MIEFQGHVAIGIQYLSRNCGPGRALTGVSWLKTRSNLLRHGLPLHGGSRWVYAPRTLKLLAELVNSIVEQGKAKMDAQHLISKTAKTPATCDLSVGSRAVNGMRKFAIGKAMTQALRQLRTPNRRAKSGKSVNWMVIPQMP